ncbi:MAG: VTT domain-containing protein [Vicinamibacterales bacterium]
MRWAIVWVVLVTAVLVPFLLFGEAFTAFAEWLTRGTLPAPVLIAIIIALLALDVFLPVPSSLISAGAGALMGFWGGTLTIWLGMTAGCILGYVAGVRMAHLARKFIGDADLRRAGELLERHGIWALAACRAVPVLAEASVVFSGLARTRLRPFLLISSLSNLAIAATYSAVGHYALQGESFLLALLGALTLPALGMFVASRLIPSSRTT